MRYIELPLMPEPETEQEYCPEVQDCQLTVERKIPSDSMKVELSEKEEGEEQTGSVSIGLVKQGSGCDYNVDVGIVQGFGDECVLIIYERKRYETNITDRFVNIYDVEFERTLDLAEFPDSPNKPTSLPTNYDPNFKAWLKEVFLQPSDKRWDIEGTYTIDNQQSGLAYEGFVGDANNSGDHQWCVGTQTWRSPTLPDDHHSIKTINNDLQNTSGSSFYMEIVDVDTDHHITIKGVERFKAVSGNQTHYINFNEEQISEENATGNDEVEITLVSTFTEKQSFDTNITGYSTDEILSRVSIKSVGPVYASSYTTYSWLDNSKVGVINLFDNVQQAVGFYYSYTFGGGWGVSFEEELGETSIALLESGNGACEALYSMLWGHGTYDSTKKLSNCLTCATITPKTAFTDEELEEPVSLVDSMNRCHSTKSRRIQDTTQELFDYILEELYSPPLFGSGVLFKGPTSIQIWNKKINLDN